MDTKEIRTRCFVSLLAFVSFVPFVPFVPFVSFAQTPLAKRPFVLDAPAEVIVTIRASCVRCDWGVPEREGAALEIAADGRYRSHLMLTRGHDDADYRALLGHFERGRHDVTVVAAARQPIG